jgi:hypothetical protein
MSQTNLSNDAKNLENGYGNRKVNMRVDIPKHSAHPSEAELLRTPKTPQNEGLSWFESYTGKEPLIVYELALEADGGPNRDRSVSGQRVLEASDSLLTSDILKLENNSIQDFLLLLRPTYYAFPWKLVPLHPRVACSRQIFPCTVDTLRGLDSLKKCE